MSNKVYDSNADRQRAWRQRAAALKPPQKTKAAPRLSRVVRLSLHARGLRELADESQGWLDRIPANLADSPTAVGLQEFIDELCDVVDRLEAMEPPMVGR